MGRSILLLQICLCVWVQLCFQQKVSKDFAGPFRFVLFQIGKCEESGTIQLFWSSTRIHKLSRTKYVYSSNLTTFVTITDEIEVEFDVAIWGNGGWRPHYIVETPGKFCSTAKMFMPMLYEEILNKLKIKSCLLPPGSYQIKEMDISKLQFSSMMPIMPYGKYRADMAYLKNGTIIGCIRGYYDVLPKQSETKIH